MSLRSRMIVHPGIGDVDAVRLADAGDRAPRCGTAPADRRLGTAGWRREAGVANVPYSSPGGLVGGPLHADCPGTPRWDHNAGREREPTPGLSPPEIAPSVQAL